MRVKGEAISEGGGKKTLVPGYTDVVRGFSLVHDLEGSHYKKGAARNELA